jgi:hypothetical protein
MLTYFTVYRSITYDYSKDYINCKASSFYCSAFQNEPERLKYVRAYK